MKYKSYIFFGLHLVICCLGIFLILVFFSRLVRPKILNEPITHTPEAVREVEKLRRIEIDQENPPVLVQEVDYSQGKSASWFPKNESPVLSDLVKQGKLPPVHERTGPEPVVVEGPEGIGKYGGTWIRCATSEQDINAMTNTRLSYPNLVRWSPQGYPIVPHIAKSYSVSDDAREFIFILRKGLKWSDGHPFTADDILYWFEKEYCDSLVGQIPSDIMKIRGKLGNIEKLDDYRIRITFPYPNARFLPLPQCPLSSALRLCLGQPDVRTARTLPGQIQSPHRGPQGHRGAYEGKEVR
jgi:hypothetical protein